MISSYLITAFGFMALGITTAQLIDRTLYDWWCFLPSLVLILVGIGDLFIWR